MMRLLFIVGHPAHVHFFKNAIRDLQAHGHDVFIGAVRKETTIQLLSLYGLDYVPLGVNIPNIVGKVLDLPLKDFRFLRYLHKTKPDLVLSVSSPYAAQACAALSIPHIAFTDTEIATAILSLTYPFTDAFVTPTSFAGNLGSRQMRYDGYKELAYLHPARFQPDPAILDLIGARRDERIIVVRLASWDSSHDLKEHGMASAFGNGPNAIVEALESLGRVVVTSERAVPPQVRRLVLDIPLTRMHDLLYYATLYIGEGATMASEAGILGTPWIFVSKERRGFLDDQSARYGLGFTVSTWEAALAKARELLGLDGLKQIWSDRRAHLLSEKIDVSAFIVKLIEDWPESLARSSSEDRSTTEPAAEAQRLHAAPSAGPEHKEG